MVCEDWNVEPETENSLYERRLASATAASKRRKYLLTREMLLVRVKLVKPLWEMVSDVNSNLQGGVINGIIP
jgi:hypothetical protein